MNRARLASSEKTAVVSLQVRADGKDARGQANGAWQDWATGIWAKVQPLRSRDFFAAGQMQASVDTLIAFDWMPGVLPTMRVVWEGRPFEIAGEPIDVDGAHHTLELMCVAGVRDGR